MSLNEIYLVGNLGKKPTVKVFDDGNKVVEFPMATDNYWDNSKDWHKVKLRGKLGELAERFLDKGHKVHITGKIRSRNYTTATGEKRRVTEIIGTRMLLLKALNQKDVNQEAVAGQTQSMDAPLPPPKPVIELKDQSKTKNSEDAKTAESLEKECRGSTDNEVLAKEQNDLDIIERLNEELAIASEVDAEDALPEWLNY